MQNRLMRYFMLVCVALLVSACSNKPGSGVVNEAMEQYATEQGIEGVFEVTDTERTNGYQLNDFYVVEFNYELTAQMSLDEAVAYLNNEVQKSEPTTMAEQMAKGLMGLASNVGLIKMGLSEQYGNFAKGDTVSGTGKLQFIDTENGWQLYNDA